MIAESIAVTYRCPRGLIGETVLSMHTHGKEAKLSLRRFFRLVLDRKWQPPLESVDDSLARTARDALHVRGQANNAGGFSSTSRVYDHIAKGYKDYVKSFKKKG